jgi:isopentenyl diphosphate isomerase/L-lactate dehydrogenase-like FMN-dependent dehydrogenase
MANEARPFGGASVPPPDRLGRHLILSYEDARRRARRVLPEGLWQYVDGGAEDERTLARNTEAFREILFHPRLGNWNPKPDLETTLFGTKVSMPILTAPCGGLRQIHPAGDVGVSRAAAELGTMHVPSTASGHTVEEIAAATSAPKWFQLYSMWSRAGMERLVERVQEAGYEALVVTIDSPVSGYRERDLRYAFRSTRINLHAARRLGPQLVTRPGWLWRYWRDGLPFGLANTRSPDGTTLPLNSMSQTGSASICATWDDIAWIREHWRGPLLIKGVLTPEDARRAVDAGSNGIVVSNHGGRQLDGAPATIDVLPTIVAAVGADTVVLLDGGVRRGGDVVRALALGARAVMVGRPYVWGLAIGGEAGVRHVLLLLRAELTRTLQLMGCGSVHELDETWLAPRSQPDD